MEHSGSGQWHPDTNSAPLRSPKITTQSTALSVNAAEFVPRNPSSHQQPQQHSLPHHQHRNRGDNGGGGGGLGSSGGGGVGLGYNVGPMVPHYQQQPQHDLGNGVMVNGTETLGKSSINDRIKNLQISNSPNSQQQLHGHSNYSDNKDIRNSSYYNHHQHHPNQHYSQQHRLQSHHQQPQQPQHLPLHQNQFPMAGMGYSSTALNNHLHHPILGGMAAAAVAGSSGPSMMPYDNRNKNNSSARSRHQNAQNLPMHHQNQHHHHHQHQQQQQHHHYQPHMSQHHPGGSNNGYGGSTGDEEQVTESETAALEYLTDVIAELYDRPGMFENMQRKLKNTFVEFRSNGFVLANAVELIFEHSIKEQNFRYMGARLIQLLDSLDDGPNSTMRQCLNQKMDFQHNELVGFMKHEAIRVRGTTLFLAELYMQLRSTDNKRNESFAMRIINTANMLLNRQGPENIKCVCQCLKLCGFELERDCPKEMMGILETLGNKESQTDCSTERFIRSVLDLQQKSWGRSEEVAPITQPVAAVPDFDNFRSNSPVLYGPDGRELTQEENDFLEMVALPGSMDDLEELDDTDDLVDDEEFNAEIQMAFEQFMRESNQRPL